VTSGWLVYACLGLALSSAMVAGVFQSFSDFVMRGLRLAEPAGGIESMQHINRTVMRSLFLTSFLVLVPLTLGFAVYAGIRLSGPAQKLIISAAAIYATSVFLVTMFGNVPMNRHLAQLEHTSEEARAYWSRYGRVWTRLNHVRTAGSTATSVCFMVAALALA
jgi:uncharacterized membrane protein